MAWKRFWGRLLRRREPPGDELLAPLRKLARDHGRSLDEVTYELLAHSLAQHSLTPRTARCWAALTPREQDVAALIYGGYSNPQIAYLLGVGLETVRSHVQRMLRKCSVHSKVELCAVLHREGAEGYIEQRLEDLFNPPPPRDARG